MSDSCYIRWSKQFRSVFVIPWLPFADSSNGSDFFLVRVICCVVVPSQNDDDVIPHHWHTLCLCIAVVMSFTVMSLTRVLLHLRNMHLPALRHSSITVQRISHHMFLHHSQRWVGRTCTHHRHFEIQDPSASAACFGNGIVVSAPPRPLSPRCAFGMGWTMLYERGVRCLVWC